MIWTNFITLLTGILDTLYNGLPRWTIVLGGGPGDALSVLHDASTDHSMVAMSLGYIVQMDKILPVHDGLFPIITMMTLIIICLQSIKAAKSVVNVVRGSGA